MPLPGGRLPVDSAGRVESDAEQFQGPGLGIVAELDVATHQLRIALERIAVTAAARRADAHPVARLKRNVLLLGKVFWDMRLTVAVDRHRVDRAVGAAVRALRPEAAMIHDEGRARLAAQELHLVGEAEAAAVLSAPPEPSRNA